MAWRWRGICRIIPCGPTSTLCSDRYKHRISLVPHPKLNEREIPIDKERGYEES
ncbi:hypothetical protein Lal_00027601 [Lupinus albus]|nr:hypothetical protein Lal_00027601 [Lupinus albus]